MATRFNRPRTKEELQNREVRGLWSAIALAKSIGESDQKITLNTILLLHRTVLEHAMPEIAGRFRRTGEDVDPLPCAVPPPGRLVQEQMYMFWRDFDTRLSVIPRHITKPTASQRKKWFGQVIELAAWVQHGLVAIHPFSEGNGRVARLMTNLVLSRFGLPPSRVKIESENKPAYLAALCQIDRVRDYAPLKHLIAQSIFEGFRKEAELRRRSAKKRR